MDVDGVIEGVIKREGGYTDHPDDHGGPTNWGITQDDLSAWRGHPVSADEVRSLTRQEAKEIYRRLYVEKPGFTAIQDGNLQALLVDTAVLQGPGRAVQWLQSTVGVKTDGVIGPVTLAALGAMDARRVYLGVCAERMRSLGRIISHDSTQAVFAAGWFNRLADFVENA